MTLKTQSFRSTGRIAPLLTGLGLAAVGWTLAVHVGAQAVTNGPVLYQGEPSVKSGIKLASWGSGAITEDNKGVFNGGSMSLRIVSHGLYQGASIQLGKTVDLGPYVDNKFAYLSFVLVPPANPGPAGAGGIPGSTGKGPGTGGGPPGIGTGGEGGSPGAPGSGGGFAGRGQDGGLSSKTLKVNYQTPQAMKNVRVVLVTSSGRQLETLLPLDSAVDDGQWKRLSIPISVLPGIKAEDAKIREIRVFGDAPGVIRLGNIAVIVDQTPITVDSLPNRDLARLGIHDFRVAARGGITPLAISWDWDASDGIQEEGQGRFVSHAFRKESAYDRNTNKIMDNVVTITVKDLYGIKKPVVTKFAVHVTP